MSRYNKDLGEKGEALAQKYIKKKGYKITSVNYRTPCGEIDIIATHNKVTVFIEVKTRTSAEFGRPAEAISKKKIQSIVNSAREYLVKNNLLYAPSRFDVIEVMVNSGGADINHIENAFEV